MALVRVVMRPAASCTSRLKQTGQESAKTGFAPTGDAAGSGEERKRRTDDLVAGSDAESHERQQNRIRSRGDSEGVFDLHQGCGLPLQGFYFRAEYELAGCEHALERRPQLCRQRGILLFEIQKRHFHIGGCYADCLSVLCHYTARGPRGAVRPVTAVRMPET